jgi:hypothetical protein
MKLLFQVMPMKNGRVPAIVPLFPPNTPSILKEYGSLF